jgi:hypothetical protein
MKRIYIIAIGLIFFGITSINAQTSTVLSQSVQNNVLNNGNASAYNSNTRGPRVPVFNPKEDTKGSRYLFTNFIKGKITNTQNNQLDNGYSFNYDKVTQKFIITQNEKDFFAVEDQNVKSFILSNILGNEMTFIKVPVISDNFYVQLLEGGENNYVLCKYTKTKLEKANYVSTGLIESGHNYDEFIDETIYFLVFPDGTTLKTIPLKKNGIKENLSNEKPKVDNYFSENKNLPVNEAFLTGLIKTLNQK